jgi:cytochrome c-type biogenesis protein CcmH/NrfG
MRCGFVFVPLVLAVSAQPCFPQGGGHSIGGHVRDEATQEPLQSVALDIKASGMQAAPPTTSGIQGEFRFGGLRDGDFYVVATKKGYDTVTVTVSIMVGGAPPVDIFMHKQRTEPPSGRGDAISARELSIPEKAQEAFRKGRTLLYDKSAPAKAIAQFEQAIAQFPAYYEAYTQIGVARYRLNKFPDAEKALRQAIEISGEKYPDALYLLAAMFNDQERFAEAEPLARQASAAGDSTWHSPYELARALVGLKRAPEAETSAAQARDVKPDNAQVYLVLANAHIQQQKFYAVVQDFDEYLRLAPNAPGSDQIRQRRDRMQEALQRSQQKTPAAKQ